MGCSSNWTFPEYRHEQQALNVGSNNIEPFTMSKLVLRTLFFLCFFLLESYYSYAQEKNTSAQEFINTISSTLDSFKSTAENFVAYLQVVIPIAENDADYKLAKNKIDSLKNYFNVYMNSLAEGISKLSKLNEFDTSLKMVTPCLN